MQRDPIENASDNDNDDADDRYFGDDVFGNLDNLDCSDIPNRPPQAPPEACQARLQNGNPNKAGMQNADKNHVNKVVYEMSKDSRFYMNEVKKDEKTQERIKSLLERYEKLRKESDMRPVSAAVVEQLAELETRRDLTKVIVHVDMDAFYAAVETLDDPSLAAKPMAVGGIGMLCTANYEARKFGIRAAMPGFIAKQLCPDLIIIPTHFDKYRSASNQAQAVFRNYDPKFDMMSLDEAYLDLTGYLADHPDLTAEAAVQNMRSEVFQLTRLTCSAGIAANRLLAKVCSDMNKPNGQYFLKSDEESILNFMGALPIRKIPGIGRVTEQILKALSINTCEEMFDMLPYLKCLFSPVAFDFLARVSVGIGSTAVGLDWNRKSISVERTFSSTQSPEALKSILADLAHKLAADVLSEKLSGKTITLKLKTTDFEVKTRSKTVPRFISLEADLFKYGLELLEAEFPLNLRLMGLRLSSFKSEHETNTQDITKYLTVVPKPPDAHMDVEIMDNFRCPICSKVVLEAVNTLDNDIFNQHIDLCLNTPAIERLRNESTSSSTPKRQKPELSTKQEPSKKKKENNGSVEIMRKFVNKSHR